MNRTIIVSNQAITYVRDITVGVACEFITLLLLCCNFIISKTYIVLQFSNYNYFCFLYSGPLGQWVQRDLIGMFFNM